MFYTKSEYIKSLVTFIGRIKSSLKIRNSLVPIFRWLLRNQLELLYSVA